MLPWILGVGLLLFLVSNKGGPSATASQASSVADTSVPIRGLAPSWYQFNFEAPARWAGAPAMFQAAGFQAVTVNESSAGAFFVRAAWKQFAQTTTLRGPIRNVSFAPAFGPTI